MPLPGALSTDPHQLQPHTGGCTDEKQDSCAGFELQQLQLVLICHRSSFHPLRISPGARSPAPLLFQAHSMCCKASPCARAWLQGCSQPEAVPGTETPWGSEGGGRAQQTKHREGRAGFDLPTSDKSNSTALLQEEVRLQTKTPSNLGVISEAFTGDNATVTGQPTDLRRSYCILHLH